MSSVLNDIKRYSKAINKDRRNKSADAIRLIDAVFHYNMRKCNKTEIQLKAKFARWKSGFEQKQLENQSS